MGFGISLRRAAALFVVSALLPAGVIAHGALTSANAATAWAPASKAVIHPGIRMVTVDQQCTANYVFTDYYGRVYIGQAAHCAGKGGATDTNGCEVSSLPLGTRVRLADAVTGYLAYSSWRTMRLRGERNSDRCHFNDFALVRIPSSWIAKTNPSVPYWGGPRGLPSTNASAGQTVVSYGNSDLRFGLHGWMQGKIVAVNGNGRSYDVYTATPAVPGDSGAPYLNAGGYALGTLSTLGLAPRPASNGVSSLRHELAYAQFYSGIRGLKLARGTVAFKGSLLGL